MEAGGLGLGFGVGGAGGGVHAFVFVGVGAAFATAGVTRATVAFAFAFVVGDELVLVALCVVVVAAGFAALVGREVVDVVGSGAAADPEVSDEASAAGSAVDVLATEAAAGWLVATMPTARPTAPTVPSTAVPAVRTETRVRRSSRWRDVQWRAVTRSPWVEGGLTGRQRARGSRSSG